MCGIVGVVGAYKNGFSSEEADAFTDLLVMDTIRGYDSTGMFMVTNLGNMYMAKGAMNGLEFVGSPEYKQIYNLLGSQGMFAVGHNRAATRGSISDVNAHPFCIDDKLVLVQNGTYKGSHKHLKDTEVDTEAIAHVIAEADGDIEKALQRVNAAYALVWYDITRRTLNIIRNDERPLYITYTDEGSVFFASEKHMLQCALDRHNINTTKLPYMIAENSLVSFTVDAKEKSWTSDFKKDLDVKYDYKNTPPFRETTYQIPYTGRHIYPYTGLEAEAENEYPYVKAANDISSKAHVTRTIHDYVHEGYFTFDFALSQLASKQQEDYVHNCPRSRKTLVELIDYLPANNHIDCTTWYVIGARIDAENNESSVYYHTLWGKTEEDIKTFVEQPFYFFSTSTPLVHRVTDKDTTVYINTVYCTEPESAAVENLIENPNTH